jgi:diguanylate cyclase (GGDEF)-like protein
MMNKQSRQLRDEVMELIGDGMIIVDPCGVIVDANPAVCELLSYGWAGAGDLLGRRATAALSAWPELLQVVRDGQGARLEIAAIDLPGIRYYDAQVLPLPAWGGSEGHTLILFHEISDYKRAETQLQLAQESLIQQLAEIEDLQIQLREQAIRDPLTGLYNRRYLESKLAEELQRMGEDGAPVSLAMVDIDHFKKVNDTYGHEAGDTMLQALASVLCQGVRGEDIVSRYGGEEFVLALIGATLETAGRRAEEWRQAVEALRVSYRGNVFGVTISIGLAALNFHHLEIEQTLRKADEALYLAKQSGRNCVILNQDPDGL